MPIAVTEVEYKKFVGSNNKLNIQLATIDEEGCPNI
jgi:hypothetical protein